MNESFENNLSPINEKKVVSELVGEGSIGWTMYKNYIGYGTNLFGVAVCLLSNACLNTSNVFSDWFLARWADNQQRHNRMLLLQKNSNFSQPFVTTFNWSANFTINGNSINKVDDRIDLRYYLTVYCGNLVFLTVLSGLNAMLIYRILITASKNLHNAMLASILRAPVSFFDINPVGRILNRFSKDTGQLDEIMPPVFYEFLTCMFSVLSIVVVTAIPNPIIIVALLPIALLLLCTRNYYIPTSRELKRLEGATRSPVFTHVSASITGLSTIRAFEMQDVFEKEFDQHQDQHTEAWFLFIACSRWMALRMDMLCSLFISIICLACVFYAKSLSSGMAGLMLTYSFAMLNLFSWFIRQNIEVENMMTSVERIIGYINLEPEADLNSTKDNEPSPSWPHNGEIQAIGVCMRYEQNGPFALNHLEFHIKSREKIGIVGRTGAGKSSLISMLFRLNEYQGSLFVDGVELSSLGLHDLRCKISIIPQDPVLFVGTLRENLDPFNKYDDNALWNSLREVQILDSVNTEKRGLETEVLEAGSNFSVGQRQLLCLARALLNSNRILVIDEATANVDQKTDELIQKTIKDKFKNCTILTIAHRINTIMDSDRIMVMDKGHIIEFDSPSELLKKKGRFYTLAQKII